MRSGIFYVCSISFALFCNYTFANTDVNPCYGPGVLINLINRPSVADSACVVPYKNAVVESGYQYQNLRGGYRGQDFPELELRFGLPLINELVFILPDYNKQTTAPYSGYSQSAIGIKHQIAYNKNWVGSIEGILSLPTGGGGFGSNKYNGVINGILFYAFNPEWSMTMMFGAGTQSLPASSGGQRFTTVNPDILITYEWRYDLNIYAEVFGQTKTAPDEGAGFNTDAGIVYLPNHHLALDAEYGQRISGNLGNFNNYYGVGLSLIFD